MPTNSPVTGGSVGQGGDGGLSANGWVDGDEGTDGQNGGVSTLYTCDAAADCS